MLNAHGIQLALGKGQTSLAAVSSVATPFLSPTTGGFGLPTRHFLDLRSVPNRQSTLITLLQSRHAMASPIRL